MKDWHLLLLASGIILIDLTYIIPLLALSYANGDTRIDIDKRRPIFTNVYNYIAMYEITVVIHKNSSLLFLYICIVMHAHTYRSRVTQWFIG